MSLTEQFLQGNIPLRQLLNEVSLLMSSLRSAIKEVNDWFLEILYQIIGLFSPISIMYVSFFADQTLFYKNMYFFTGNVLNS